VTPALAIPFFRPEAIELFGPVSIQPFGVLLALGFILAGAWGSHYARKRGIDPKTYTDILFWMALGGIVFGHLGHIFYEPQQYIDNPLDVLKVWSGLSSFGGYFGCTLIAVWFFRKRGIKPLRGGDILVIGLTFGIFIGRLGCFVVHDHIGLEVQDSHAVFQKTIGWLAVEFPSIEEAAAVGEKALEESEGQEWFTLEAFRTDALRSGKTHQEAMAAVGAYHKHYPAGALGTTRYDLGLMDSLLGLSIFLVLLALARKPRPEGQLLALTPMMYAPVRLVWDSLRNTDLGGQASDVRYVLGMTPGQYASILLFFLGVWALLLSKKQPVWPTADDKPWVEPAAKPS
jgi:phosphatidylglycerol:prolipoprotein diacylglycerol transferase